MGTPSAMKSGRCDGWNGKEGKCLGVGGWKTRTKYTTCKETSSEWDNTIKYEMYV
jgi:hypothetical protein